MRRAWLVWVALGVAVLVIVGAVSNDPDGPGEVAAITGPVPVRTAVSATSSVVVHATRVLNAAAKRKAARVEAAARRKAARARAAARSKARSVAREARAAALARDQATCTSAEKAKVRAGAATPPGCAAYAAQQKARSRCDPNYAGACLKPDSPDYDCRGGSGDGPDYIGPVRVVGDDHYGLDRDGDGIGCQDS
jgi:hypothetical protein